MEQIHRLPSTLDSKMVMTDDNNINMEGLKMETENKQTLDNDFSDGLSDETHQRLTSKGPSCSCRRITVGSRLQSTKSCPPHSQCIGGLGEDGELDNALDSRLSIVHHPSLRHDDMVKEDRNELVQGTERKEDFKLNSRCSQDDVMAKWRMRREKLGASYEVDSGGWESAQWREEQSGREREQDEIERKDDEDEERKRSPISAVEGENGWSGETPKDEEAEELLGITEGPTTHQWSSPHPILSKLLHSSTTSSSINLSSAESDEIFSEGEDAGPKRKTFREVRMR